MPIEDATHDKEHLCCSSSSDSPSVPPVVGLLLTHPSISEIVDWITEIVSEFTLDNLPESVLVIVIVISPNS